MINLYLFKSTPMNITNLVQFCFMLSVPDLYDPCHPTIVNNRLTMDVASFVKNISPGDPLLTFREVDWTKHTDILDEIVNANRVMAWANNNEQQIEFIKNYLTNNVKTVGCYYSIDEYDAVLTYFVKDHLARQNSGEYQLSTHDIIAKRAGPAEYIQYCKTAFTEQGLVANSLISNCDYNIHICDLFSKDKFFDHLKAIGCNPTATAMDYYDTWFNYNKDLI